MAYDDVKDLNAGDRVCVPEEGLHNKELLRWEMVCGVPFLRVYHSSYCSSICIPTSVCDCQKGKR